MGEQSSFIANAEYDPSGKVLNVWFNDGRHYRGQVEPQDGQAMIEALTDAQLSAGRTFNQRIKPKYQLDLVQDTSTTTGMSTGASSQVPASLLGASDGDSSGEKSRISR